MAYLLYNGNVICCCCIFLYISLYLPGLISNDEMNDAWLMASSAWRMMMTGIMRMAHGMWHRDDRLVKHVGMAYIFGTFLSFWSIHGI